MKGHLVDTEGRDVAQARILVDYCPPEKAFPDSREFLTDKHGNFDFTAKPGSIVRARKEKAMTIESTTIDPDLRWVTLVLHENALASVIVHIVSPDDEPVHGAEVTLFERTGNGYFGADKQTTNERGVCVFSKLLPDIDYRAHATDDGFGITQTNLNTKPGKEIDGPVLKLIKADSFVAGVVVDAQDHPMAAVKVSTNSSASGVRTTRTDRDGKFRIDNIVPRDRVIVWAGSTGAGPSKMAFAGDDEVKLIHGASGK